MKNLLDTTSIYQHNKDMQLKVPDANKNVWTYLQNVFWNMSMLEHTFYV